MANICENKLTVLSSDIKNINYILKYFDNWKSANIAITEKDYAVIYFDSKWDFPSTEMNEMVKEIPNKEDIDITVLSVEEGEYYCAFHTYRGDTWEYQG